MWNDKMIEVWADFNKRYAFEQSFGYDKFIAAGYDAQYGLTKYIVTSETNFIAMTEALDKAGLYYTVTDYQPEKDLLSDCLRYMYMYNAENKQQGWRFERDEENGYISIFYHDKEQGVIMPHKGLDLSDTSDTRYAVVPYQNNELTRSQWKNICDTVGEVKGNVTLTTFETMLDCDYIDTTIKLPNGFEETLHDDQSDEINTLHVVFKKPTSSFFGQWGDKSSLSESIISADISYHEFETDPSEIFPDSKTSGVNISLEVKEWLKDGGSRLLSIGLDKLTDNIERAVFTKNILLAYVENSATGERKDVTSALTAKLPECYYMRKFHLQYTLPDGNVWKGMINVTADNRNELPSREDIKGAFWAERLTAGWLGKFQLENGVVIDSRAGKTDTKFNNSVINTGVYPPDTGVYVTDITGNESEMERARKIAEEVMKSVTPIDLKGVVIPRFEGRLEDCIYSEETHCFPTRWKSAEKDKSVIERE